jgi:hypothetical protein
MVLGMIVRGITPGPGIVFIAGIGCHTIIVSSRVQAHFTNSR